MITVAVEFLYMIIAVSIVAQPRHGIVLKLSGPLKTPLGSWGDFMNEVWWGRRSRQHETKDKPLCVGV